MRERGAREAPLAGCYTSHLMKHQQNRTHKGRVAKCVQSLVNDGRSCLACLPPFAQRALAVTQLGKWWRRVVVTSQISRLVYLCLEANVLDRPDLDSMARQLSAAGEDELSWPVKLRGGRGPVSRYRPGKCSGGTCAS